MAWLTRYVKLWQKQCWGGFKALMVKTVVILMFMFGTKVF